MLKTALALTVFVLLFGCSPKVRAIPDPTVPHRVAKETDVTIYVRLPSGEMTTTEVRLLQGWWIAGPPVVEPMPAK